MSSKIDLEPAVDGFAAVDKTEELIEKVNRYTKSRNTDLKNLPVCPKSCTVATPLCCISMHRLKETKI